MGRQRLDGAEGGGADMMLHSFDIAINHAVAEPEQSEEVGQKAVPMRDVARHFFAGRSQHKAAILFVFEKAFGAEALDHVGDAGLRDLQSRSDIDDAGVTLRVDQLQNAFEIIFHRGRAAESGT